LIGSLDAFLGNGYYEEMRDLLDLMFEYNLIFVKKEVYH
jgi:hypothetical protein